MATSTAAVAQSIIKLPTIRLPLHPNYSCTLMKRVYFIQSSDQVTSWTDVVWVPLGAGKGFFLPPHPPTQPPNQWILGALSLQVNGPGHEGDHSPPSRTEVKNRWSYISKPHTFSWRGEGHLYLYTNNNFQILIMYRDRFNQSHFNCIQQRKKVTSTSASGISLSGATTSKVINTTEFLLLFMAFWTFL